MNAKVTILHDVIAEPAEPRDGAGPDDTATDTDTFDAQVLVLKQPLMQLATPRKIERDSAIRIDTSDAVWLGEAEECVAAGDGFSVRVKLRHVLRDFETLARLAERFGGPVPAGTAEKAQEAAPKGTPVEI
jgi:hypothetical protein